MSIFKPKWHRSAGHRLQKPGWLIVAIAPSACGRGASEPQGVPAGAIDGDGVVAAGGGHSGGLRTTTPSPAGTGTATVRPTPPACDSPVGMNSPLHPKSHTAPGQYAYSPIPIPKEQPAWRICR